MKKYIIGVDEAGRGPLAGPIVSAAVLSKGTKRQMEILGLVKDSKKLSPSRREDLFFLLIKNFDWSVHFLNNKFIDKYGIQKANVLTVHESISELRKINMTAQLVADYIAGAEYVMRDVEFHKQGEDKFAEIAAASIIAKVYRDRMMMDIDKHFPHYEFWLHKGYGTKKHYEKIKQFGISPLHRKSFLKNFL